MGAALPAGSAPTPRSGGDSMRGLSLDLFLTGFSSPDFSRVFWVCVFFLSVEGFGSARRDVAGSGTPSVQLVWVLDFRWLAD